MNELKRHKMDLPPPPSDEEAPKIVPGSEFEPTWEQKLGIRSSPVIGTINFYCFSYHHYNTVNYIVKCS